MLILSRRENQRILFPNLGISVEICRIAGNSVRVGVEAPPSVRVLRDELALDEERRAEEGGAGARRHRHELRNRLNTASLALHLVQKQLDAGRVEDAETTLARALQQLSAIDRAMTGHDFAPSEGPDDDRHRALLVEDNPHERELLAGYLRLCGYQVDTVEDGLEAMEYLKRQRRPDLVLLDMQMPRMDGRETITAIRSNPSFRGLKVFAVSGSDRKSMRVDGPDGVDRWFSKPFTPADFVNELNAEMRRTCAAI